MKTNLELITLLTGAIKTKNQDLINIYALELAKRLYVPNDTYTFEETLAGFGYKQDDSKQITIEEYMRGRKKDDEI